MRFTASKDGAQRATVRVDFRVDRGVIAEALALAILTHANPEIALAQYGRDEITATVRQRYQQSGPPEQWPENEGFEWNRALDAATERVQDLWPEDAG